MFLQLDHLGMILTRVTVTAGEAAGGAGALLEEDVEESVPISVIRGVIGLLIEIEVAIIPQLLVVELVWMGLLHLFQDHTVDHARMILGVIIMVEEGEVLFEDEAVVVEDVVEGRGVIIVWCTTEIEILVMEEVVTFDRSPIGNELKVEVILGQLDRTIIAIGRVILRHQGRQVSVWDLHRRLWNAKNWIIAM